MEIIVSPVDKIEDDMLQETNGLCVNYSFCIMHWPCDTVTPWPCLIFEKS